MRRHTTIAATLTLAAGLLLAPGSVAADRVGEPGEPSCFGERISHGSSDHELTPEERAQILQGFYDESSPEEQAFFTELLDIKDGSVTAGVMTRWVRLNCSGEFGP